MIPISYLYLVSSTFVSKSESIEIELTYATLSPLLTVDFVDQMTDILPQSTW